MQCVNCLAEQKMNLAKAPTDAPGNEVVAKDATTKVWCPTWTSANEGVLHVCDEHAKVFKNSNKGQFFYDEEATKQFIKVEAFIPKRDIKFESLKNQIISDGYHIAGEMSVLGSLVSVLNGFVYVITCNFLITKLGKLEVVQKEMPKLFPEEGHRMIYVRAGDQDDYNQFVDLHGAIDYLQSMKVNKLQKTSRFSYHSDEFTGNNYISLYWGANRIDAHEPICDLTADEVIHINDRL